MNTVSPAVTYGDSHLTMRIETSCPEQLHSQIMKGINTAMKLSLLAEDVTREEKDALLALNELLCQMIPSEATLEQNLTKRLSSIALSKTA